jgi:hypothetical protein
MDDKVEITKYSHYNPNFDYSIKLSKQEFDSLPELSQYLPTLSVVPKQAK